jgi:hypothetical protein
VSLIGYADLDRPVTYERGRIYYTFGGGAFQLEPFRCGVLAANDGKVAFQLDIIRSLSNTESRAILSCTVGAEYASEEAIARVRDINPTASLLQCVLTDWWFRLVPTPALGGHADLLAPAMLASNGLGTGRLMASLSVESGLILEAMLLAHGSLEAVAEAQISGVSPRVPAVVRFDSQPLLDGLLELADDEGALPRRLIVDYFRRELATLPLDLSGTVDVTNVARFADTMTDRVVARFGRYIPSRSIEDAPVVLIDQPRANSAITWALSQPVLAGRRIVLPVDLLSTVVAQIDRIGADSVIRRRDMTSVLPLGQRHVTAFCNLPASRAGVDALGVTLRFPPAPPARPQEQSMTAMFESVHDVAELNVRLSPQELLRYRYASFAVLVDEAGARQIDGQEAESEDSLLQLSPDDFPIEFALIEVAPALGRLAIISGTCAYELDGRLHERRFSLDSGQMSTAIAIPRERSSVRIDAVATARDGSGELSLGPFESLRVWLDLTSFASYGPRQTKIRCVFDDNAALRAISILPAGRDEAAENITTLSLTQAEPVRTFRWFALSPFAAGFRYRPYDPQGGGWMESPAGSELVLYSSDLQKRDRPKEIAARAERGVREASLSRPVGRSESAVIPESTVVPIATSPSPDPSDQVLYNRVDDPTRKMFVPRYSIDVQTVSGLQRYRIAMGQRETSSTLEVNLIAAPAAALMEQARDAAEYPHSVIVQLDFLVVPPSGARKVLEFTDVTRNGAIVTAGLTFATLAERDDVYRALTERERQARLVVRRFIDVLVPQRTPPPRPPVGGGGDGGGLGPILPRRPLHKWPPKQVTVSQQPVVDVPIGLVTTPGTVRSGVMTSAIATAVRARTERARVPAREAGVAGFVSTAALTRPTSVKWLPLPPDHFVSSLPVPRLAFTGRVDDNGLIRYGLSVANWAEFSDEFFAASPDLPPCGLSKSASRTWIDVEDADTGRRLYGFCALASAKQLAELWFAVPGGEVMPTNVHVRLTDRRTKLGRTSNAVATVGTERSLPSVQAIRAELEQTVLPEPFVFPPALHGYIFQDVTPTSGTNQLIRYRFSWRGTFHTYLQDASRLPVVYVFADQFKIARRRDAPFTPLATVRVSSEPDGTAADAVFDYVVAPYIDPKRLASARTQLLADPRFGATEVEFQPFLTSDVRFAVDRPSESGAVREQRPDAAVVLQGALKDTLAMPLGDFRLLFDAMHRRTASLFVGRVDIDVPNASTEIIPFTARMDDLEGEMFSYDAAAGQDGRIQVALTNQIESPVDIQTLDATITHDGRRVRALVQSGALPRQQLRPGETMQLVLEPESALSSPSPPEVTFDLGGVTVTPDPDAIWDSILDRTTLDYFKLVTVRAVDAYFAAVTGKEDERIVSILVEFEHGSMAELTASELQARVRVDYPIDDVILGRPVATNYRYTVTVIRANGDQERDPQPREGSADLFFVSVVR